MESQEEHSCSLEEQATGRIPRQANAASSGESQQQDAPGLTPKHKASLTAAIIVFVALERLAARRAAVVAAAALRQGQRVWQADVDLMMSNVWQVGKQRASLPVQNSSALHCHARAQASRSYQLPPHLCSA